MKKLLIGIVLSLFGMSAWADIPCPMTVYCVGTQNDSCIIPAGWERTIPPQVNKKSSLLTAPIIRYSALTFVRATGGYKSAGNCSYEGLENPYRITIHSLDIIMPDVHSPSNRWHVRGGLPAYGCISPTHPEQCLFKATP